MDQTDLEQVSSAAQDFLSRNVRLDGLLLNAAFFGGEYTVTKQGHEAHFGVNHLSHYLLAELLKDKLIESAPARIVIVSSESHREPKATGVKYEELSLIIYQSPLSTTGQGSAHHAPVHHAPVGASRCKLAPCTVHHIFEIAGAKSLHQLHQQLVQWCNGAIL